MLISAGACLVSFLLFPPVYLPALAHLEGVSIGTPLQNRVGELYSLIRFVGADPYAYYYCKRCDCKSLHWLCTKGPCTVSLLSLAFPLSPPSNR